MVGSLQRFWYYEKLAVTLIGLKAVEVMRFFVEAFR